MDSTPAVLATALEHHQAGRLQAAEQIYRQILAGDPHQPDALHLLGVIARQVGQNQAALQLIRRAIELKGNSPDFHNNLGGVYLDLKRFSDAIRSFRAAIQLKPDYGVAFSNLGYALREEGQLEESIEACQRAIQFSPESPDAHVNLGNALRDQGEYDQAISSYRRALDKNPNLAIAHNNLGNVFRDQKKLDEAVVSYQRALDLNPNFAEAWCNLGNAFKELGRLDEAVTSLSRSLALNSNSAETFNNLGSVLIEFRKLDEAVSCCRRALELKPDHANAHHNLGNALMALGQSEEAIASYRRALEITPNAADTYNNLGGALQAQGKLVEAAECHRLALELKPGFAEAHSNVLLALQYREGVSLADLYAAHAEFNRQHCVPLSVDAGGQKSLADALNKDERTTSSLLAPALREEVRVIGLPDFPPTMTHRQVTASGSVRSELFLGEEAEGRAEGVRRARDSTILNPSSDAHKETPHPGPLPGVPGRGDKRIRVGFVSADLGRHPVGYFLIGLLENFDRDSVETFCYSDGQRKDDMTERLRKASSHWRETVGLGDEPLCEQICTDRIDVLFDLAGHTAHNRMLVFARKPASIQVSWAGYASTTGLTAMDYILADRHEIPGEYERFYQERILRMPDGYVCYEPPAYAPLVSPLPAIGCGYVTFGCFNNPAKITPQVIDVWGRVLKRLPDSRLILKYKGWNDPSIVARILSQLDRAIDPARLEFLGQSPHAELLAEYSRVDLALDSFPYSGGLTTCEAIWMGVPVVTCPGETFASRHSLSHLSNVAVTETIAIDFDEYVEKAVALASDLPRLAAIRAGLRSKMAASPLCDGKKFACDLTRILRELPLDSTH